MNDRKGTSAGPEYTSRQEPSAVERRPGQPIAVGAVNPNLFLRALKKLVRRFSPLTKRRHEPPMVNVEGTTRLGSKADIIHSLGELEELVRAVPAIYLRYSERPVFGPENGSIDTESGLRLPGLSTNPLTPESWWTRPLADWLARQLCQYKYLQDKNPARQAWGLEGRVIARGPDCEPLLIDVRVRARLDDGVVGEAEQLYKENFDARSGPED